MIYLIQVFGFLMIFAGIAILIDPQIVFGPMRRHKESIGLQVMAVTGRLVLGSLLVANAALSRYPTVFFILGCVTVAAALILALLGSRTFVSLMSWALGLTHSFGRTAGVFAAFFGAFLVFSFI